MPKEAGSRSLTAEVRYFSSTPPPEVVEDGVFTLGEPAGISREEYKRLRHMTTEAHEVSILDARTAFPGGLGHWRLDTHGFCCAKAPPSLDFSDRKLTKAVYYPKMVELAKQLTGAKEGYLFHFLTRTENPANLSVSYARFCHADGGPESPPFWRRMLVERFQVPEEEAEESEIAMLNAWHPFDRPAYKDPLCLLDASSVLMERETVFYRYLASTETKAGAAGSQEGKASSGFSSLKAYSVAPSAQRNIYGGLENPPPDLGPVYAPGHRWVYCPDQRPEEAWFFKQYDTRPGVAKCAFHTAFHDPFHDKEPDCPGRRSAEFRILLTFPKQRSDGASAAMPPQADGAPAAMPSKL